MTDRANGAPGETEAEFTLELELLRDYRFEVRFDWADVPPLELDEPEPLGDQAGPNASRLLAAAVGNCLSASLLFCLHKARVPPEGVNTRVRGRLVRNDHGRLRIGGLEVDLNLIGAGADAKRLQRCLGVFEDYCVVTASVREGIPVDVHVSVDGHPLED